mmetsp:Transcript_7423/g.16924  ORF Transcript_7423/g.16924 Transcript_7423/m.16924 type:complete len:248 (+) Transcript_7423:2006-2749(+)
MSLIISDTSGVASMIFSSTKVLATLRIMSRSTWHFVLHSTLFIHSHASSYFCPNFSDTTDGDFWSDLNSWQTFCTISTIFLMSAGRCSRTSFLTATTKQGHGVGISPTRRKIPWSTRGFVMNFSQRKPFALPSVRASCAPLMSPTVLNFKFAVSHPSCFPSTKAMRWEPEVKRLIAQTLSLRSFTLFTSSCFAPVWIPQQRGLETNVDTILLFLLHTMSFTMPSVSKMHTSASPSFSAFVMAPVPPG